MRITVVLHPWHDMDTEECDRLVRQACTLAGQAPVAVWVYQGDTHPAAVSARLADSLAQFAEKQLVLLPTGTDSEAIAAMSAARMGGISLGRCSALQFAEDGLIAQRAAFGGRVALSLRSQAQVTFATLRPQGDPGSTSATAQTLEIVAHDPAPFEVQALPAGTGHPRIEGSPLVVSGGRGMGGPEGFEWLTRIALALGAGLGGSLPAVDAGWVPVSHQVGQSGKFVTPKLYFAVGISGTMQHMAGVSAGTRIVALNNAPNADIFSRCDFAVHGDWREILPLLTLHLENQSPFN